MQTLLIALGAGIAFLVAYHTYGRWLGAKIFHLAADVVCPSHRLRDDKDYIPTPKPIVFGHHFTSIAGTGPIVGPAIAVMWGWVPALMWVVFGSIFIGAVHDFGALVVSLRNNGQTVGDIAGRVLNKRVRLLFLIVLFMALTIVLAIFGLVIAAVFRLYPASIFPCLVQIPIAVAIGVWLHKQGRGLLIPSLIALAVMYLTVIFGDANTQVAQWSSWPGWMAKSIGSIEGSLHSFNTALAGWSTMTWVIVLLVYSYVASVLPVWTLLQPRDYINSLQLITALGLIVVGLVFAAFIGGAPPVEGAQRVPLEIVAPAFDFQPADAPLIFPFLFITIACGAISGFHCLVSSGTSSKQLDKEPDARFVGYGGMLTEGFLATLVILACVAGLGLGNDIGDQLLINLKPVGFTASGEAIYADFVQGQGGWWRDADGYVLTGSAAWRDRYASWSSAGSLGAKIGAFVDGSANFLKAMNVPAGVAIALMGVLVASFAGTTLDTACRLQRYVVQELAGTFIRTPAKHECSNCLYDLTGNISGKCPECGAEIGAIGEGGRDARPTGTAIPNPLNPFLILQNKHGATLFAITIAAFVATLPGPSQSWADWSIAGAGSGGLILWPLFGATNQLLAGLSFLVVAFYLWRRKIPVFFIVIPMIFMLIMPAWAMFIQVPQWWNDGRTILVFIGAATIILEGWMVVEAILLWPKVRGLMEEQLAPTSSNPEAGVNC